MNFDMFIIQMNNTELENTMPIQIVAMMSLLFLVKMILKKIMKVFLYTKMMIKPGIS
jgi:hypothetical protein